MRISIWYTCLFILICFVVEAQNPLVISRGKISYVSTQNVYVQFEDVHAVRAQDTLQIFINNVWYNALIVESVSSRSCITRSITKEKLLIGMHVINEKKSNLGITGNPLVQIQTQTLKPPLEVINKSNVLNEHETVKQVLNARISVSTNGSMEASEKYFSRIRTTASLDISNINGGKFSFENYIVYARRLGAESSNTFADDVKMYSLSLAYDVNQRVRLSLGRRINNLMANMGAIDGVQVELKNKNFQYGGFGGSRPDYLDYSFNPSLFQFGAYLAHEKSLKNGIIQSSLAFSEQQNNHLTDRRFVYLQHSNSIIRDVSLFYSLELDLYQNIDSIQSNQINLTSTYLSIRYKPSSKLSFTASYDNRKNVIYYETYRTYIDQLMQQETRQGLRMQVNYNVSKNVNLNLSGFYRYQSDRVDPTKNYLINVSINQVPSLGASLNINANLMNTYYFDGMILGARLNKDFFNGVLSTEINYRKIDYQFFNLDQGKMSQDVVGVSLNLFGRKRTALMISYEGTFEANTRFGRYYLTLTQRFKSKKNKI